MINVRLAQGKEIQKNWLGRQILNDSYANSKTEIEAPEKGSQSIGLGANQ